MKKMLMAALMVAAGWVMVSCGGGASSTPESVVEKAMTCIEEKDYAGYLELIDFQDKDGKTADEIRKEVQPLLEAKVQQSIDKKGGIKSWEILETTIAEDGNTAKVKTKIVYGNHDVDDNNTVKLVKKEDGKWMLDANK